MLATTPGVQKRPLGVVRICHLATLRNLAAKSGETYSPIVAPFLARADCPEGKKFRSFQFSAIVGIKPLGCVTP